MRAQRWSTRANRYGTHRSRGGRLATLLAATGVMAMLLAGCALTGGTTDVVPPPALPFPRILAVADVGRASLSQTVQIAADPAAGRVYLLGGHQIVGPLVSAPWADHIVAVERDTGAVAWQYGTSISVQDRAHRLSGIVVDRAAHRVIVATTSQVLALDSGTGSVAARATLLAGIDCVGFPAPTQPPTLDAQGRVLFACRKSDPPGSPTGVLVDLATGAVTLVAPPSGGGQPAPPGPGILGHRYVLTDTGLLILGQGGTSPIAALPLNIAGLAQAPVVEAGSDGTPTGRVYVAGIGGQVVILQDAAPEALRNQTGTLWATVVAERAVALTVAPARFQQSGALPTLPGFLVAPGDRARTACFGEARPFAPDSVTASTQATQEAGGTVRVELSLSVRGDKGEETAARHWVVSVASDGTATIQSDQGSVDPFQPLPPQACPL